MLLEHLSPVAFQLGPFAVRWYGLMFALSLLIGFYCLHRDSRRRGIDENALFGLFFVLVLALVLGARGLYVVVNWSFFSVHPEMILRVDRGGLAFHGGLAGGLAATWLYCRVKKLPWRLLADLSVPGIATGIALVRVANIFNQEILGREATLFFFERHPAQVYGSLIGLTLLLVHNYRARRGPGQDGSLFWGFVLGYSLLRGLVEETFRDNPLIAWGYINDTWGAGFFSAVQLATPALLMLSLVMLRKGKDNKHGKG